jgi:hypothetical protein
LPVITHQIPSGSNEFRYGAIRDVMKLAAAKLFYISLPDIEMTRIFSG